MPTTQHGPAFTSQVNSGASSATTELLRSYRSQPAEGSRAQKSRIQFLLPLPLFTIGCATLGQWLNLSEPLFPALCKGGVGNGAGAVPLRCWGALLPPLPGKRGALQGQMEGQDS